jgi:hypothetical protein
MQLAGYNLRLGRGGPEDTGEIDKSGAWKVAFMDFSHTSMPVGFPESGAF